MIIFAVLNGRKSQGRCLVTAHTTSARINTETACPPVASAQVSEAQKPNTRLPDLEALLLACKGTALF